MTLLLVISDLALMLNPISSYYRFTSTIVSVFQFRWAINFKSDFSFFALNCESKILGMVYVMAMAIKNGAWL